jgi:putative FmdB family regulatory protein
MPIYEYKCSACGHQEDHLQKLSEPALTKCPACGRKKYAKQLTAAGFQLKGSGWYASDFKGGKKPEAAAEAKAEGKTEAKGETKAETKADTKAAATKSESKPEKKTPASTTN